MMILTQKMIDKLTAWQAAGNTFNAYQFPVDVNDWNIKDYNDAYELTIGTPIDGISITLICWGWTIEVKESDFGSDFDQLIIDDIEKFKATKRKGVA